MSKHYTVKTLAEYLLSLEGKQDYEVWVDHNDITDPLDESDVFYVSNSSRYSPPHISL